MVVLAAAAPLRAARWPTLTIVALGAPFLVSPSVAALALQLLFGPRRTTIVIVVGGFLFSTVGGSVVVEQTLTRIRGLPRSSEEAEATGRTDEQHPGRQGTGSPAGGRAIGMLERAFAYSGVLLGHPEAAALVVAVKAVARYPEFTGPNGRRFAEYFLVGTLLSLLFAFAIAYLIRAALGV